jgi:ESCRT-I complex subunit MVB12
MFHQMNPELRSITAISIVEDVSRCPLGYTPILRTQDADADADLWRDGFFGKRITRYVCVSKSQGRPEHVISAIQILHDRELPPEGFSLIQQTVDSSQKAFKKKQLCFKLANIRSNCESIVEMVAYSKLKHPLPDSFEHIGDINGIHFCVRKISAVTRLNTPSLSYGILPGMSAMYPTAQLQNSMNDLNLTPSNGNTSGLSHRSSYGSEPNSPANAIYPAQPLLKQSSNTLSHLSGLEGVPFTLREDLKSTISGVRQGPKKLYIIVKTDNDIEQEYSYDFRTEKDLVAVNGFA